MIIMINRIKEAIKRDPDVMTAYNDLFSFCRNIEGEQFSFRIKRTPN